MGSSDMFLNDLLEPPLTSLRIPQLEAGQRAMALLLNWINGSAVPGESVLLTSELVVRGSTAPPSPR